MGFYSISGIAQESSTRATIATLWNPHTTKRLRVIELGLVVNDTLSPLKSYTLRRILGSGNRGTPGSTITPAIQQSFSRSIAPPSGAVLDLATYLIDATFEVGLMVGWQFIPLRGAGLLYSIPRGIELPPQSGLSITNPDFATYSAPKVHVWFCWEE